MVKCPHCQHEFSLRKPIPPGKECRYCFEPATKKRKDAMGEIFYFCDKDYKWELHLLREGKKKAIIWMDEWKKAMHDKDEEKIEELSKITEYEGDKK